MENGSLINLQALTGESLLEKERRLSEMILQLQMVRDQLLNQQQLHTKVRYRVVRNVHAYSRQPPFLQDLHISGIDIFDRLEHFSMLSYVVGVIACLVDPQSASAVRLGQHYTF